MNCKPGDLVILLRAENPAMKKYVGTIRIVVRGSDNRPGAWYLEPPVYGGNGLLASWYDENLKPIRDQPGNEQFVVESRKSLPRKKPVTGPVTINERGEVKA